MTSLLFRNARVFDGHSADAQACADAIRFAAVGAITQPPIPWINRPTFQQAVEIPGP